MKVKLIGKPRITNDDGTGVALPGRQTWAVLVRLLMADRPLSRSTLARELFCEAADPLGALRWALAALRRAFGRDTFRGDPVEANLPPGIEIDLCDVLELRAADVEIAELLEGVEPAASAEFSTWLLVAREQVASRIHQRLRRNAVEALARGDPEVALRSAERAARLRPLDEGSHILLVRALVGAGRVEAAMDHVRSVEHSFLQELGEPPSPALRHAARGEPAGNLGKASEVAAIEALIRRGTAALSAGALELGFDCLRRAHRRAEDSGDAHSLARAAHELGAAYVHAQRGFDDAGAVLLSQAVETARTVGAADICAAALRELGYLDALVGRRPSADRHLSEALAVVEGDTEAEAGILAVRGFNFADWGRHDEGLALFERSIELARACRNRRREIWSLGIGGWAQLRAGRVEAAERWLSDCLERCAQMRWVAFEPWPRAVLAEARLAQERSGNDVITELQEALALSTQLGDPCWEAANARAMGLQLQAQADGPAALRWLDHARSRCCSVTDFYAGLLVQITADRMQLHFALDDTGAGLATARELLELAARTHADHLIPCAAAAIRTHSAP